ncbi:glycosyltransferase [Pseudonocardia sp.]|uniref:glycosyltransferase family 4 protein n=1 Tax=Pseudonocardia sp. TaxID=60912 RepID=UPI00260BD3CA|nr:glycosyltransferase [Pseudonocardia sp.]
MRIAVIGPAHPYKGGVAQYTTELARRLGAAGHEACIESWSHQYPAALYPGQLTVTEPELPLFAPTHRRLSWRRPDSWFRCGRRLRGVDLVVLVMVNSVQVPAYLGILAGLGRRRDTRVVAQCHNVLPHEKSALDVALVRAVLSRVDGVVVHSVSQGEQAAALTARPVTVEHMSPLVVAAGGRRGAGGPIRSRLLFFGMVRPYKGLDVLLRALAAGPDGIGLRVAGEFWGGTAETDRLIAGLGLGDRVELRSGYVDSSAVPELFADVDALVLPYRSATASLNAFLAFEHGVPVIATRVGTIEHDVTDGVDGVLCEPDDVDSLRAAIERFYREGEPARLRAGVGSVDSGPAWDRYCAALVATVDAADA